ncbi:MAG: T9SS type A sorting domain-containing protein, partial [Saprospiraceae bacterium]|nr:T9SS type A sorting domain-containing protein [Saprospiraceae bacterium]
LVRAENDKTWKLDQNLQIEWVKETAYGRLFAGAENDFFVVPYLSQPDPTDPILIHHFHADGQFDKTLEVYSKSQPYYVAGGVSQLNNGPVLFAVKYDAVDIPRNWMIYIDRDGNLASEQLLPEQYSPVSLNFRNQFIQTSDGGVLAASPRNNRIYMLKVKNGKVVLDASFANGTPEESTMQLLGIEEVNCKGYVLSVLINAYQSFAPKIIPETTQTILLYHLDENGHGQKTFSYRPLPEPSSPNTDFISGYTYRRWGYQLNNQTYDLLLETVHFPDSLAIQQPAGALSIMPNPSPAETCLEYQSNDYGVMEVQVFNAAGVLMDHFYSKKTEAIWHQSYRSQAPKGTYVIRTRLNDQDWVSRRWVKMH